MPLPSGLPESIGEDELLARFLTSSSYFNAAGAKAAAFLPAADHKTSVLRHGIEPAESLWAIGGQWIRGNLHGAAIIIAVDVRSVLELEADEPPARHANIIGWPVHLDAEFQRSQRKELALRLAEKASLVRPSRN